MRSYVNRKGEQIQVSDEHLDTAIKIKEELQKTSPTRRTSWAQHRRMMEIEGFLDSDTNEAYRCLIKSEQKKRGVLPTLQSHAEVVKESTLESIREEIGELASAKMDLQQQGAKVRKLIRSVNKDVLWIQELTEAVSKKEFVRPSLFEPHHYLPKKKKAMIVCLSDIHYGAYVDIPENFYDRKTCATLLSRYADKVLDLVIQEKVSEVHVVNLGDLVENAYLRNQSLYSSEETLSEQVVNVTDLIIEFLNKLSEIVPVTYSGIAGNHDRIQGDKNSSLHTDHVVKISNKLIESYAKYGNKRITYIETESYFHSIEINGFNFAFIHGDKHSLKKQSLLAELSSLYGVNYAAVIGGHIHHFTMVEVGENKYQATFGSIKGIDDYSMTIGAKSCRSQGVVLVDDENFEIRKVNL